MFLPIDKHLVLPVKFLNHNESHPIHYGYFALLSHTPTNICQNDRNYSGWRFGKKWFPRNTCLRDARTLTPCFLRVEI